MIEIKANVNEEKRGCEVSLSIEGYGNDILHEALAIIQGVMGGLKDQSFALHLVALKAISENPWILTGSEENDVADDFEKFVATSKLREGVH